MLWLLARRDIDRLQATRADRLAEQTFGCEDIALALPATFSPPLLCRPERSEGSACTLPAKANLPLRSE